jgi:hypothetical protein
MCAHTPDEQGTSAARERARYDWQPGGETVTATTRDSRLFGAGGGWTFTAAPDGDGTRVDAEPVRQPATVKGRMLAVMLLPAAPGSPRKSCARPLQAA